MMGVTLGYVGLGRMGKPMALHLLTAGYQVVVHNRSRTVIGELTRQGAIAVNSPREVAEVASVILTALPTPASVEEVYLGADGFIHAAHAGQIYVDHSTVSPAQNRACAQALAERGADFLDAPVSGGPAGAQDATLTLMIGGKTDVFERVKPVFAVLGKQIRLCGDVGAGQVIKLVNQLLVGIHSAAAAEAMVFGVKAGANPLLIRELMATSFGGSAMFERNVPRMLERAFEPATSINLLLKDLGIIHDEARTVDVHLVLGTLCETLFLQARGAGCGDQDLAALVRPLEQIAGIEVKR